MHKLNAHTQTHIQADAAVLGFKHTFSLYLQIAHFEGPDLLFGFHPPNFNHAAHVARGDQRGVMAEHGTCHRVFVT